MWVQLLNFERDPGVPLLNFVLLLNLRGSRVPFLNFEEVHGSICVHWFVLCFDLFHWNEIFIIKKSSSKTIFKWLNWKAQRSRCHEYIVRQWIFCMLRLEDNKIGPVALFYEPGKTGREFIHKGSFRIILLLTQKYIPIPIRELEITAS